MDKDTKRRADHYDALVAEHGLASASAQWSDRTTQYRRFAVLSGIAPSLTDASILDLGCGTGELCSYLTRHHNFRGRYSGVDVSVNAIALARKAHPTHSFYCQDILQEPLQTSHDFAIISGLFNNKLEEDFDGMEYLRRILKAIFPHVTVGLAFNAMSKYVDYESDNLCYFSPEDVLTFCKNELSGLVVLRHDYLVKPAAPPFEFSVYVYRNGHLPDVRSSE